MNGLNFKKHRRVHRRTGGLEMMNKCKMPTLGVHRRTGGLESLNTRKRIGNRVHRRTGGLES